MEGHVSHGKNLLNLRYFIANVPLSVWLRTKLRCSAKLLKNMAKWYNAAKQRLPPSWFE